MSEELMDEFELITITSEDGTEEFFAEADSVEYEGKTFILLVPVTEEGELREEADPILARIEEEDGEEIFVSPTEAEFDAVIAEFEKASAEEEEELISKRVIQLNAVWPSLLTKKRERKRRFRSLTYEHY